MIVKHVRDCAAVRSGKIKLPEDPYEGEASQRIPPHSTEAEQGVLGCCLVEPNSAIPQVMEVLTPESFYEVRHQTIFRRICEMANAMKPVDVVTLIGCLRDHDEMTDADGIAYVSTLPDLALSTYNLPTYIEAVRLKAKVRGVISSCTEAAAILFDADEPEALLDRAQAILMGITTADSSPKDRTAKELVLDALEELERIHNGGGKPTGVLTGIYDLDKMTGGLHPQEVTIIAARPSCGKTSLALNIAERAAVDQQIPVAVFSLEMGGGALMARMIQSRARASAKKLDERGLHRMHQSATQLAKAPIHICDTPALSISQLRAKARRMFQQHGVKLIIIDYLQLLHSTSKRADSRVLEIGEISRGIKTLAMELNIPIVALSQLNRESERDKGRRPRCSDLRESGDLEQDADNVWLLYRSEDPNGAPIDPNSTDPYELKVIIGKQRNGPKGEVPVIFFPELTRFESQTTHQLTQCNSNPDQ
jgi:replicative DNA helicase